MKNKLFMAIASAVVFGGVFTSSQAFAISDDAEMKKILLQEQKLEHQVQYLTGEVAELKKQKRNGRYYTSNGSSSIVHPVTTSKPVNSTTSVPVPQHQPTSTVWANTPPSSMTSNKRTGRYPVNLPPTHISKLQGERVTNGVTVTTSPYLGLRSAFDASDLVVNISTLNEDLRLLQQRQKVAHEMEAAGEYESYIDRPLIILSGGIEAQAGNLNPFQGASSTEIDLTRAEFDILSYISTYITGLITMAYDNGPFPNVTNDGITTATAQLVGAGQRVGNSRYYLKRGFFTIGDLDKTPFYFSMGQMYAPFGTYSSQIVDATLPQAIGQTNERLALLGFYEKGIYLEGYAYNGETNTSTSASTRTNRGGGNIGFKYSNNNGMGFNIGAGIIANIADSLGLQETNAPTGFQGFGFSTVTEQIKHTVPATNVHAELDIKKLTLLGEFVGANRAFDPLDLSFNNEGARPAAYWLEGDYTFHFVNVPSVFTLAYGHSYEALPLNLPQNSYVAEITMSIWKDTIENLEFRHDANYPTSDISSGNNNLGLAGTFLPVLPPPAPSVGGTQNTITAQVGVYF